MGCFGSSEDSSSLEPTDLYSQSAANQCKVAFSAPRPVFARTTSSVNCSSAVGSRVRSVPRIAARKPSGMLTMPGLVSGKSGAAWMRWRLAAGTSAASIPMIEGLRIMSRMTGSETHSQTRKLRRRY